MASNKILRVFTDVHMGLGHAGLTAYAAKHDVHTKKLVPGEHLVFINKKVDKMKIYSAENIVSYKWDSRRLEMGALSHFNECFGAEGFEYTNALRKVILQKLSGRPK